MRQEHYPLYSSAYLELTELSTFHSQNGLQTVIGLLIRGFLLLLVFLLLSNVLKKYMIAMVLSCGTNDSITVILPQEQLSSGYNTLSLINTLQKKLCQNSSFLPMMLLTLLYGFPIRSQNQRVMFVSFSNQGIKLEIGEQSRK